MRPYQVTKDEAAMFLAGDPLRRRIGRLVTQPVEHRRRLVGRERRLLLIDRDHNGTSHLADGLRHVPLPVHIFDQDDFANADDAGLAIARGDLAWAHPS